jgi:hypothetical protein
MVAQGRVQAAMKALGKGSIASAVKVALDIGSVLLRIAAIILGVLGLAYVAIVALTAAGRLDPSTLAEIEGSIRFGDGDVRGYGWPAVILALLIGGIVVGGAMIIVGRLRKLFEGFSSGEPFRREYAGHLRVIWITMLAMEVARFALTALMGVLIVTMGVAGEREATLSLDIDLSTWLSIAVLVVLAEVFREGARLREEQELTI